MNEFQKGLIHAIRYEFTDDQVLALIQPKLNLIFGVMKAEGASVLPQAHKQLPASRISTVHGTTLVARQLPNRSWRVVDENSLKGHKKPRVLAVSPSLKDAFAAAKSQVPRMLAFASK